MMMKLDLTCLENVDELVSDDAYEESVDGWIPCEMINQCFIPQLATKGRKKYLVTYETITGRRYVKTEMIRHGRVESKTNNIIAYMDLPEPYKGSRGT